MDELKNKVLIAIQLCNQELKYRKQGIEGESTEEQLENIILPELKQLLILLETKQMPPYEKRYLLSFASAFTIWGWNMQRPTKIFLLLAEINNAYKNWGENT